jgi:hypothetical protein
MGHSIGIFELDGIALDRTKEQSSEGGTILDSLAGKGWMGYE